MYNYHDVILDKTMQFLCIKHEHSRLSFKKLFHSFKYLQYWIHTNIIHINHSVEIVRFLYKHMKICTKFVQTYQTW
jgi:hypothetical protein